MPARNTVRKFSLAEEHTALNLFPLHFWRSYLSSMATFCGGIGIFTSGSARAPRPDGGGPPRSAPRLNVLPAPEAAPLLTLPRAVLAPWPGAVIVGDTRALSLPVPVRAPLLARYGVVDCEVVFPSPAVHRRLAAPCVPPYSLPCL